MLLFLGFVLIHCYACGQVQALVIDRALLDAIKQVESGGNPCAVGDNGKSLGAYQIMEAYYNDSLEQTPRLGDAMVVERTLMYGALVVRHTLNR